MLGHDWTIAGILKLFIAFVVCLPGIFAHSWIVQGTIPDTPIILVGNAFRYTILVTLCWKSVDC